MNQGGEVRKYLCSDKAEFNLKAAQDSVIKDSAILGFITLVSKMYDNNNKG